MVLLLAAATVFAAIASPSPGNVLPTVRTSIALHIHASADHAFPMFNPVNESRWDPDWKPTFVGGMRVASGLVFTTHDENGRTPWLLDRYDTNRRVIRYVLVHPRTLSTIDITVIPDGAKASVATVTYTRTALDTGGVASVRSLARHFPGQRPHWEQAINATVSRDSKP
jgi:hypothetical protein